MHNSLYDSKKKTTHTQKKRATVYCLTFGGTCVDKQVYQEKEQRL